MKNRQKQLETTLVIAMGFLVLYFIFHLPWLLIVSLAVGLAGILSSFLAGWITWFWDTLARGLNYVIPKLLLGITFYFILFPLALLSRMSHKDPLLLSRKHGSYFVTRNVQFDKSSFEKVW
ncbi:MAG: hypothetical protein JXA23_09330 [Bacteroidales bacterium]|nr:hypothetical protein [Bacteroidales bacterium]